MQDEDCGLILSVRNYFKVVLVVKQTEFASSYLSEFYMELHLMIRAGLPFQEGIALLLDEESNKTKKLFLQQMQN